MTSVADEYRAKIQSGGSVNATATTGASVADEYRAKIQGGGSQGKRGTMTAPPVKKSDLSLMEQVKGGLRAAGQGMTLNTADEIASGMATLGHKAENFITGGDDDRGWGEVYDAIMADSKARRDAFAEQEPTIALTSEVLGGFAGGGAAGGKVLATQAVQNAPKLLKAVAAATTGGVEGTVAGFSRGDSYEDRIEQGKSGQALGLALPLALSGGGTALRAASDKFKLPEKLRTLNGKQEPLNIADKGWRGTVYRDIVNNSFGGGKLADDAAPYIQEAGDAVVDAKHALTRSIAAGKENLKTQTSGIKKAAAQATEDLNLKFRQDVTNTSLPQKLSDNAKAMLAQNDLSPQQIAALLKKEWADNGFDMINSKYFDIDDKYFKASMKGLFDDSPALKSQAGQYMTGFRADLKRLKDKGTGQMSGKNFMELRNSYARDANASGADPAQAKIFRTISNKIDEYMTGNLPDADKAAFIAEKKAYDSHANMMKATGKAKQKGGSYTPKEWLASTSNARAATGTGPQQDVADAALDAQATVKRGIDEQITALPTKAQNDAAKLAGEADVHAAQQGVHDLQERLPVNSNLWNKLLSTKMLTPPRMNLGLLGAAGGAVGGPLGAVAAMGAGTGIARGLASNPMQRLIAGQSVDELLDLGSKAKVGGLSLADILRQGTTAGTVQSQIE